MPAITGRLDLTLRVPDPDRSARWYADLLRMDRGAEVRDDPGDDADGPLVAVTLAHRATGLALTFMADGAPGRSDGAGGGEGTPAASTLDRIEIVVAYRGDLDAWRRELDARGIPHDGVDDRPGDSATLAFRDPDGLALALAWRPGRR